jgi:hypothetical protein
MYDMLAQIADGWKFREAFESISRRLPETIGRIILSNIGLTNKSGLRSHRQHQFYMNNKIIEEIKRRSLLFVVDNPGLANLQNVIETAMGIGALIVLEQDTEELVQAMHNDLLHERTH